MDNILMLEETLETFRQGQYEKNGVIVHTKLKPDELKQAVVLLPNEVEAIEHETVPNKVRVIGRCGHTCTNEDSFTAAINENEYRSYYFEKNAKEILVLNFANPVHPGGGVRRGARAQEEDLCRKSSLLMSLESKEAARYYEYNRSLNTYMGSDAIIISPKVEIIRDRNGELLDDSVIVSVMTCAAPMITYGLEGMSKDEYETLLYNRIVRMLKCAAHFNYKGLVLGAWGCGAFGNDAHLLSDLFYKALKEFDYDGLQEKDCFRRITFAVLDKTSDQYNFKEFYRNFDFDNFFRDENQAAIDAARERKQKTEVHLDAIRGCLFGGAVGDALGYPIEFFSEEEIFGRYGMGGLDHFELDASSGKALISDDTQMSLFTGSGLLIGDTRGMMRGIRALPHSYVALSYQGWLWTQECSYESRKGFIDEDKWSYKSWLLDVPELYSRRAPGNTCLSALAHLRNADDKMGHPDDYIKNPFNESKGCGGIMRVAPLALRYSDTDIETIDEEGAQIAAITHGHSLGYMSAAVLVHIINRIVYSNERNLKNIVVEAKSTVRKLFKGDAHIEELERIIDLAVELSENSDADLDNIHRIGEGWVAEETLGIAIYCALKYQNDFSKGVIVAANHKGDSDSTAAVTGNILGAYLGYEQIEEKWKKDLELSDVIIEMADDLCHGCQMTEYGQYHDPEWVRKYMEMHWRPCDAEEDD